MYHQYNRILIANRGEIAVRIIKTAHKMGIECIAVYTELEKNALHVKKADISVLMHGSSLQETYLNQDLIISIAKEYFADAIHPGYGFLSENGDFAQLCEINSIQFIGPSAYVIKQMGNKEEANKIASKNNIPLLKKLTGNIESIINEASDLDFPLIIKAAAGGGGKGMRVVNKIEDLHDSIKKASDEAQRYFGNDAIYVEPYIEDPRHIEVQVLADKLGNLIHLYERDCSIQRRHQKIIEEAPAPYLAEEIRTNILKDALTIAKSIGYTNAGTIEFILAPDQQHYFLEMNTRIQVEHTVTEEITGIDIIEQQLRISMGQPLDLKQEDIIVNGHAIEVRLYAEDPDNNYMPSHGTIKGLHIPKIPQIRVDNGIRQFEEIHTHFDSLLKKVIAKGQNRDEAIRILKSFLKEYTLFGIETNKDIILYILNHQKFFKGEYSTSFVANNQYDFKENNRISESELKIFASAFIIIKNKIQSENKFGYWRHRQDHDLIIENKSVKISLLQVFSDKFIIQVDNNTLTELRIIEFRPNYISFSRENVLYKINYLKTDDRLFYIQHDGRKIAISDKPRRNKRSIKEQTNNKTTLLAPTPGNIVDVLVKEGANIKKGTPLVVIEAMKTENILMAWKDTLVKKVHVKTAEHVSLNQVLIETE